MSSPTHCGASSHIQTALELEIETLATAATRWVKMRSHLVVFLKKCISSSSNNFNQQGRAAVLCWRCFGSRAGTYRTATRALGAGTSVVVISLSYFSMVSYYKVALQCCYLLLLLWQKSHVPTHALKHCWCEMSQHLVSSWRRSSHVLVRGMGARNNIFSSWRRSSHVRKEYVCRSNKKIFSPPVSYVAI